MIFLQKQILSTKKSWGLDVFTAEYYWIFKEEITQIMHKLFHKIEREECLQTHSAKLVYPSTKSG
jgi:hypothetical protein